MIKLEDVTFDYKAAVEDAGRRDEVSSTLREWGIVVLSGYYSPDDCAELIDVIDTTMDTRPDLVRRGGDRRVFGADALDERIKAFGEDALFQTMGLHAIGKAQRSVFTMANRVDVQPGVARRSGGDWHRDRMAPQYKAMVYLSDVKPENGAFAFYPRSNRVWPYGRFCVDTGFDFFANRWTADVFAPFEEAASAHQLVVTAPPGTVVLFESSNIHSGLPIQTGRRYALTNYYYAEEEIDVKKLAAKFTPCARPITMPDFGRAA